MTLATTTVHNVQGIMDWGATFDSATATHSLVLHRRGGERGAAARGSTSDSTSGSTSGANSSTGGGGGGAWVFGAGTVQWAWGLDGEHDVNDPQRQNKYAIRVATDPRGGCREVQQLTVNVRSPRGPEPAPGPKPERGRLVGRGGEGWAAAVKAGCGGKGGLRR